MMNFTWPDIPEIDYQVNTSDCIKAMKDLPDKSVDVVVTSPPYNLGKSYNKYMDKLTQDEFLNWSMKWIKQVERVLKDDGSFFLNLGSSLVNPTLPHGLLFKLLNEDQGGARGKDGFMLQNTIHWVKSITVIDDGKTHTVGHFKPINSNRFINDCHEYVFHLTKTGNVSIDRLAVGVPYKDKSNISRWKGDGEKKDLRCRGNTWFLPYKTITNSKKDRDHPATFPPELPENCILLHGKPEESVVLDPFLGLGNSWIAATRNRVKKFIGFDLDSYYVKESRKAVKDPATVWANSHLVSKKEAKAIGGE